jgi:hypothetical protein
MFNPSVLPWQHTKHKKTVGTPPNGYLRIEERYYLVIASQHLETGGIIVIAHVGRTIMTDHFTDRQTGYDRGYRPAEQDFQDKDEDGHFIPLYGDTGR